VEEKILKLQEQKRHLVDEIITEESSFIKSLEMKDLEFLLS
jgi:SNF2 family DNA or RNA helicase